LARQEDSVKILVLKLVVFDFVRTDPARRVGA
jgi:hypothetical protein